MDISSYPGVVKVGLVVAADTVVDHLEIFSCFHVKTGNISNTTSDLLNVYKIRIKRNQHVLKSKIL